MSSTNPSSNYHEDSLLYAFQLTQKQCFNLLKENNRLKAKIKSREGELTLLRKHLTDKTMQLIKVCQENRELKEKEVNVKVKEKLAEAKEPACKTLSPKEVKDLFTKHLRTERDAKRRTK